MRLPFRPLAALAAVLGLGVLPACDTGPPPLTSVTFNGVTYNAIGTAELFVESDGLLVDNLGSTGGDGVRADAADGEFTDVSVTVLPVPLGETGTWGMQAFGTIGASRAALATARAEAIGGGLHSIQVDFAPGLGVTSVVFEYFLHGILVDTSPPLPAGGLMALATSGGTTNSQPQSVHAVREGGVVVVGTDYRDTAFSAGPAGGRSAAGCSAALITVTFRVDPICSDDVRAIPIPADGGAFPTVVGVELTGANIGEYKITDGSAD